MKLHHDRSGKYHVRVEDNGAIHVGPGDWLSKYSAAIHDGDVTQIREFARMGPDGRLRPIRNVDLIYAGETIYHIPTYCAHTGKPVAAPDGQRPRGPPPRMPGHPDSPPPAMLDQEAKNSKGVAREAGRRGRQAPPSGLKLQHSAI